MNNNYDVVIVGAGVTGTALAYVLSTYTNAKRVAVIEKYGYPAQVSSRVSNNSQTLHVGDIESHYTVEKATTVKERAGLVAAYADAHGREGETHRIMQRMVLAVGEQEVADLEAHYASIKHLFPAMQKIGRDELERVEPKVVEGRDPSVPLLALYTPKGYVMNYGRLAESMLARAQASESCQVDTLYYTSVEKLEATDDGYNVHTECKETSCVERTLQAKTVVVAAGSYSLAMAHTLGYGTDLTIIPVAGNFYQAPNKLNGKVYTMQIKGLPFAAIHGDPDVVEHDTMRFGPIPMAMPLLEPRNWKTFGDFVRQFSFDKDTFLSIIKINADPKLIKFLFKSFVYGLPFVGKRSFIHDVHKIIPTMDARDLSYGHHLGGIRPQVVDKKARKIRLGVAKITGEKIIFNITPSPGASVCLASAKEDVEALTGMLPDLTFDQERFMNDFKQAYE